MLINFNIQCIVSNVATKRKFQEDLEMNNAIQRHYPPTNDI